ncbi:MAG: hypothetical protein JO000_24165 [Alphaproteobacteria bacterium]|nr:hypothetical protein [Alphaproteobacteria bacterium]
MNRSGAAARARAAALLLALLVPSSADAQSTRFCSAFHRGPCIPSFCSAFHRGPCLPDYGFPIGEDLRLTIETRAAAPEKPEGDIDTISSLFRMLRACFVPPLEGEARAGTQVAIRLSFKRSGELMPSPRWTYTSPDTPGEARQLYRDAVTTSLAQCAPLHFSHGMAGAIAGRPIAIRYVENRQLPNGEARP